jgi:hypothetical protein
LENYRTDIEHRAIFGSGCEIVWVDLMIRDTADYLLDKDKESIIAYVQTIMLIGLALLSSIVGMFLL